MPGNSIQKKVRPQLRITDKKMLSLPGILKELSIINLKSEFYDAIGIKKQNVTGIKKSDKQHFTVIQIKLACEKYNVSADYIFGFSDILFRGNHKEPINPAQTKTQTKQVKRSKNNVGGKI